MRKISQFFSQQLPFILFIGVLLIPALDRKLHFLKEYPPTEKRDLAQRPLYSLQTPLMSTISQFERYWNDNFGGRSFLIHWRTQIWARLLHDSPLNSVVVGQHGWLFYASEAKGDGPGINDEQGLTPFSSEELQGVVDSLISINTKLKEQHITLLIAAAPNKSTIYPEELPLNFPHLGQESRLDQLKKALPKDILFVDLRAPLIAGKATLPTYQMTDSHWNTYGAFLAAQTLLQAVPQNYHLPQLSLDQYILSTEKVRGEGDLSSMIAARGIFSDLFIEMQAKQKTVFSEQDFGYMGGRYASHAWQQSNRHLPRLLVFGDSFRTSLMPFLIPSFSVSHAVGFKMNYKLNDEIITTVKPDIVIWEVAERYLDRLKQ